jgi:hypothetical protein
MADARAGRLAQGALGGSAHLTLCVSASGGPICAEPAEIAHVLHSLGRVLGRGLGAVPDACAAHQLQENGEVWTRKSEFI